MFDVVLDTNMFLSAFLFGGQVEIIISLIIGKKLHLYSSPSLEQEIFKKLHQFSANEKVIKNVKSLLKASRFVTPTIEIDVCRDAKDNFVLELAETAKANFLITRDKDLLDLTNHKWKGTKIIRPEEFLPLLRSLKLIN